MARKAKATSPGKRREPRTSGCELRMQGGVAGTTVKIPPLISGCVRGDSWPRLGAQEDQGEAFCPLTPLLPLVPQVWGVVEGSVPGHPERGLHPKQLRRPRQLSGDRGVSIPSSCHLRAFAPCRARSSQDSGCLLLTLWVPERPSLTTLSNVGPLCDSLLRGNLFYSLLNTSPCLFPCGVTS